MTQTLAISFPLAWNNVLAETSFAEWRRGDFVVEHPELDVRSVVVSLALAVSAFSRGRKVALYIPFGKKKARAHIRSTYQALLGRSTERGEFDFYGEASIGELWVSYADDHSEFPGITTDEAFIADAHRLACLPTNSAISRTVFTTLCDRGTWQYEFARSEEAVCKTMPLSDTLASFPEQGQHSRPKFDPYYRRKMLVLDEPVELSRSNFLSFARTRINIVTQKPVDLLTEAQRSAAEHQYGMPLVPFDCSRLQKRYLAMKRLAESQGKRPWYVLVKYRRGGFTTIEQALSYRTCTEQPRSTVVTLADSIGKTKRIFNMVNIMHANDPRALPLEGDSKSHLEMDNGSTFFIGTAGSKAFARGDTLNRAHGSEVAFWCQGPNQTEKANEVLAGVMGATEHGEITLESTPNGRNFFYSMYMEAKNNQSEYTPIFLRWFDDPMNRIVPGAYNAEEILETLSEEETELIGREGLQLDQIAYRRQKKREFGVLFPQEFPEDDESCFLVSGLCFFDIERLTSIRKRISKHLGKDKPLYRKDIPGGYETVWEQPVEGRQYVIGVDTSEGLPAPCDLNGLGILDKATGHQVAALHGRWKPEELGDLSVSLSKRYNRALLGIERNNHGHSVLNTIRQLGYDSPHYLGGSVYYYTKDRAGFSTDKKSRPLILDTCARMIVTCPEGVRDEQFVSEAGSFRLQKSGKWEADSGTHDDTVMKWSIAYRMREIPIQTPTVDFS